MDNSRVLMVLSHADDEILFGWPVFQNKTIKKSLLCCSTDENNPAREWCKFRKNVLQSICFDNMTEVATISAPSDFYSLDSRRPSGVPRDSYGDSLSPLRRFTDLLEKNVKELTGSGNYDYVFTHNPYGEYGHSDHKLVSELVFRSSEIPVIYTDIRFPTNWASSEKSKRLDRVFYQKPISDSLTRDENLFNKYMKAYEQAGVWTWSRDEESSKTCRVYVLE
jgi:LmbE family N-acetylglucosaminyl deacetylase